MEKSNEFYELICVIVNYGVGGKVLKIAKKNGVRGGTVFYGTGTAKSKVLKFFEFAEQKKEIVVMVAPKALSFEATEIISRDLKFDKPNHGIAFTINVPVFLGGGNYEYIKNNKCRGEDMAEKKYNSIFTIVDKGKGEDVMDIATESGAKGGTIINARGSGIHETTKLFNMEINPEKEIVLILSEQQITKDIATAIRDKLKIDQPGNGIIFILDVNKTFGIA
jgi:nitrogen regulatory protein PII